MCTVQISGFIKSLNFKLFKYRYLFYESVFCDFDTNLLFIENKKDGYRQQNVRQWQKLISIIDYDFCILEYLQPFWRYSTSKNGLTLKSGYLVLQGH